MGKEYIIETRENLESMENVKELTIGCYPWGEAYMPKATAKVCYIKNKGFGVQMTCYEREPLARFKEENDPVYKDSCLEFFVNFYPEDEEGGYINFEMNSLGTLLCQYGKEGGEERAFLKDKGIQVPKITRTVLEDSWQLEFFIEEAFIESVYGKSRFEKNHEIRGNFYKCGDETEAPHYGCWSPIVYEIPSFHRPEQFGKFIIG